MRGFKVPNALTTIVECFRRPRLHD
jgi:hypothetical protein